MKATTATIIRDMTQSRGPGSSSGTGEPLHGGAAAFSRHERWLRTVVLSQLAEPQAVDEVMQEVALAVAARKPATAEPTHWLPWLYRVAVRQALLYRRKLGRERRRVERYAAQALRTTRGPAAYDPLALLLDRERRERIRTAMGRLHRRDAEILLLKYSEGWSYRELAEHLGLGESTVQARLHRARKRLRAELARLQVIEVKA